MSFTSELRSPYELRQTIRRLARLVEVSVTLNSTLDIDRLLQYITDTAADLLDCETAAILLNDETEQKLFFAAVSGADLAALANNPVPLEGSQIGQVFRSGEAIVVNEPELHANTQVLFGGSAPIHPRTWLGVPLHLRESNIGVLQAINKRAGKFSQDDQRILGITASLAAVAINNARLVQALQRANDELAAANKLKSDFLAIASHELRTPLGVLLGYTSLMREEAHNTRLHEHAETIYTSAVRLKSLVDDITNLNLLQAGHTDLHERVFPIQNAVAHAYRRIRPQAEEKGLECQMHIPRAPLMVRGDQGKLELVVGNLLDNAIRFTPSGGTIKVRVVHSQDKTGIEVSDTGLGIDPKDLKRIFAEFFQAEDHLTRRHGGMGLGLAIARGLVELHGGRIWAESNGPGTGATFKVMLPLVKSTETPANGNTPTNSDQ